MSHHSRASAAPLWTALLGCCIVSAAVAQQAGVFRAGTATPTQQSVDGTPQIYAKFIEELVASITEHQWQNYSAEQPSDAALGASDGASVLLRGARFSPTFLSVLLDDPADAIGRTNKTMPTPVMDAKLRSDLRIAHPYHLAMRDAHNCAADCGDDAVGLSGYLPCPTPWTGEQFASSVGARVGTARGSFDTASLNTAMHVPKLRLPQSFVDNSVNNGAHGLEPRLDSCDGLEARLPDSSAP